MSSRSRPVPRRRKRARPSNRRGLPTAGVRGHTRPTHAGGVIYRIRAGAAEYLLVSPSDGGPEWVLPKGHIQPGESDGQAAVREVLEETGIVARLVRPLRRVRFRAGGAVVDARFFLMECISQTRAREPRHTAWWPFAAACGAATHAQTRQLLRDAERARRANADAAS